MAVHGFPVVLRLAGKRCVVVGTGTEAGQKAADLKQAGADVVLAESWGADLLDGAFLIVAAGPDRTGNAEIFAACERLGILVNCLDDPPYCRFTYPSVHRQGDLLIAVSTNGACPALAVRLRERFEREFGPEYAVFLEICRGLRDRLAQALPDFQARKELWYRIVDSPALKLLRRGRRAEAEREIETLLPR